jgi:hypothetical protein
MEAVCSFLRNVGELLPNKASLFVPDICFSRKSYPIDLLSFCFSVFCDLCPVSFESAVLMLSPKDML